MQVQITGVFWMARSDWDVLLPLFTDRANFPETYEQWRRRAESALQEMARGGINAVKVRAEPDEFLRWCRVKGLDINSHARTAYASEQAAVQWFARGENQQ